ncbi:MAG TPA: hypothetical protein VME67_07625 [Mycobacterium sp.]|nr:hypothetical protein [Mycobacterium sp.]HTX94714.1 hypothetical protein [Mycobacterium sp.]
MLIVINPWPGAQIVEPLAPDLDVAAAVGTVREIVRSRGKPIAGWWIAPEHDHLAPMLEELGLVNEDTPGFEAVENAMALVSAPSGAAVNDVEVRLVQSFEEYEAAAKLAEEVFGLPPMPAEERRQRYEEMRASATGRQLIASVEGRIVGSAFAALGAAAVNLFGGGVHPDARGRGVYRALTLARWDLAVERGTPALTVQAGRMSLPICERLGFQLVEPVRLFVDRLDR